MSMKKIVGVELPFTLKVLDCDPKDIEISLGDFLVVEGPYGPEIGKVVYIGKEKGDSEIAEVIRKASSKDLEEQKRLAEDAKQFYPIFVQKIKKYHLKMKPIGAKMLLDNSKVVFYFSAEGRVDFRELAKDLSRTIKKQAILYQIGPRDEAKIIGGYGRCGLPVCCRSFTVLGSVSTEDIEKAYGIPKSAYKSSGVCGRLMCCLKFEEGEDK